jgi:hypothetical protein
MRRILVLVLGVLLLAACAPDPRNQADADRTRALTEQDVFNMAQAREQDAARITLEQAEREATSAARIQGLKILSITGALAAALMLAAVGIGAAWAAVGVGKATARAANVHANLVYLDRQTRQFPLLVQYASHGRYLLANPNTGAVYEMDTRRPEVKALITSSAATQRDGSIAHELRHVRDPKYKLSLPKVLTGGTPDE